MSVVDDCPCFLNSVFLFLFLFYEHFSLEIYVIMVCVCQESLYLRTRVSRVYWVSRIECGLNRVFCDMNLN